MATTLNRYRVSRIEETYCESCGCPLDEGDTAFFGESVEKDGVFCSITCGRVFFEEPLQASEPWPWQESRS